MDKFNTANVIYHAVLTTATNLSPFPLLHIFLGAFTVEEEAEIWEEIFQRAEAAENGKCGY